MESITHVHLLSVLATECQGRGPAVRILDVGCGAGGLIRFLERELPALCPQQRFELRGLDVSDFAPEGTANLAQGIEVVAVGQKWPFPAGHFDFIISNQVMEHVLDHSFVFGEISRALKPDGASIHLFPLKSYIYEGHVLIPFAHRFRSARFFRLMERIGFGRKANIPRPEMDFGERVLDYLNRYTNYLGERELRRLAKAAGLEATLTYTPYYYTSKLRALSGRPFKYRYPRNELLDYLSSLVLRYVSSITLVLRPSARS
jgi:SAM-dependent methyltransferase